MSIAWLIRRWVAALLPMLAPLGAARAQCPDGTPPPCRGQPSRVAAAATPAPNSVAVLYFDNLSPDSADAYLADGLTEEIISRLGEVGRLSVKSRHLVRRFRGSDDPQSVGRQLAVANVVTGSVRRAGNRLRVTAEMVRTATGNVAWSERYDRSEGDVLALQEDLARAVATAIAGRLLPAERQALAAQPTRNREAYDRYLRGNFYLAQRTPDGFSRAIREFEVAARLDPSFNRALARVAYTYALAAWRSETVNGLAPDSSWRVAASAALQAVRHDAAASDSWLALGLVQMQIPESLPTARAALERAVALDPQSSEAWHILAWTHFYSGQGPAAVAAFHRALAIEPQRPITLVALAAVHLAEGRLAEALRMTDSVIALDRTFAQGYSTRAQLRMASGDTAGARADLATQEALGGVPLPMRSLTMRDDEVLDRLERTTWRNSNWYFGLRMPPLNRLRGNPRYERLLEEWRVRSGIR